MEVLGHSGLPRLVLGRPHGGNVRAAQRTVIHRCQPLVVYVLDGVEFVRVDDADYQKGRSPHPDSHLPQVRIRNLECLGQLLRQNANGPLILTEPPALARQQCLVRSRNLCLRRRQPQRAVAFCVNVGPIFAIESRHQVRPHPRLRGLYIPRPRSHGEPVPELACHSFQRLHVQRLPRDVSQKEAVVRCPPVLRHLSDSQRLSHGGKGQYRERDQHQRHRGQCSPYLSSSHVGYAQREGRSQRRRPADVSFGDPYQLRTELPDLHPEARGRQYRYQTGKRQQHKSKEDYVRRHRYPKCGMHRPENQKHRQENRHPRRYTEPDVGESEEKPLHKEGERKQKRHVENHPAYRVVPGPFDVRIDLRFERPRPLDVGDEILVSPISPLSLRLLKEFPRMIMKRLGVLVLYPELGQFAYARIVKLPHVARSHKLRRVEKCRLGGLVPASRRIALRGVYHHQPLADQPETHRDRQLRPRFRERHN